MKTALLKAQEEYKKRINDPSYIAPKILRTGQRSNVSENSKESQIQDKYKYIKEIDPDSAVREDELESVPLDEIEENYLTKIEMLKKKLRGE